MVMRWILRLSVPEQSFEATSAGTSLLAGYAASGFKASVVKVAYALAKWSICWSGLKSGECETLTGVYTPRFRLQCYRYYMYHLRLCSSHSP